MAKPMAFADALDEGATVWTQIRAGDAQNLGNLSRALWSGYAGQVLGLDDLTVNDDGTVTLVSDATSHDLTSGGDDSFAELVIAIKTGQQYGSDWFRHGALQVCIDLGLEEVRLA